MVALKRWKKAQKIEDTYWAPTGDLEQVKKRKISSLYDFGHVNKFKKKKILEVGCTPRAVINFIASGETRIGIEPLISSYAKRFSLRNGVHYIQSIGENLPIHDNSIDIVMCFNTLDHVYDPRKVISETHRVLKEGGELLLSVHVFRSIVKFLSPIVAQLDRVHPHHLTFLETVKMLQKQGFMITKRLTRELDIHSPLTPGWKKWAAKSVAFDLAILAKKPRSK